MHSKSVSKEPGVSGWKARFFTIWGGQRLSWIGSSVAGFGLVWWLTETTGSATVLALGTLVTLLPGVILGPFVGALVDRWNRRLVMLVADGAVALLSAGLAVLFWTGVVQVWHVYVVMLARAVGNAFHWSAMTASTSLMVPERHLSRVSGLGQAMGGAVNVLSPPLGAFLLEVMPLHGIMAIDVATAAFAIVPLLFVHVPQPERAAGAVGRGPLAGGGSLWGDVREGLRYVRGLPGLLAVCVLAMLLNFAVAPAMALVPILVSKHFGGEAIQLGWMNSAWGGGLVLGGLALGAWGGFRRRIVTMLVGIVGLGAGLLLAGLAPATAFPLAVGGFFFAAVMNALCNGAAFALLQQVVAPEMQGRVFMLVTSMCNGITPLSILVTGPLADAVGVRPLYVVGGIVQVLLGLGGFLVPAIAHLEGNQGACASGKEAETATFAPAPAAAE